MGKKAKRTKIERGGGGDGKKRGRGNERRRGRRRRKRRRRISSTGAFLVVGPLPRFVSPLVAFTALKQWAYISWAAHACEIVLIYRWAITRSHILGSRLHVGLVTRAAQLSWRGAKRGADGKGEKIGGGRWDQPRFEREGGRRRAEFISIRGGACSDNASVAFHPLSDIPFFDFSLIETSSLLGFNVSNWFR